MSRQNNKQLLTDRETFERYESHSRPTSTTFPSSSGEATRHGIQERGELACEYRAPPPGVRISSLQDKGRLACEYRQPGPHPTYYADNGRSDIRPGSHTGSFAHPQPQLACEFRQDPHFGYNQGHLEDFKGQTKVTTYLPNSSNKRKIPLGAIVAIAIAVPILIIVCLFGAVWLQELGIL